MNNDIRKLIEDNWDEFLKVKKLPKKQLMK